ncbi:hypothetical protein [Polaromonas sp.]|uniref:hypothetical protein n=1 Tax=Polaromonas sp. TaxID=1869339 RepID=UPI0037522856
MTCAACQDFARNRHSGSYRTGCPDCTARHLSQSPAFAESAKNGSITQAYRAALDKAFGADWLTGHAEVKRFAGLVKGAPL